MARRSGVKTNRWFDGKAKRHETKAVDGESHANMMLKKAHRVISSVCADHIRRHQPEEVRNQFPDGDFTHEYDVATGHTMFKVWLKHKDSGLQVSATRMLDGTQTGDSGAHGATGAMLGQALSQEIDEFVRYHADWFRSDEGEQESEGNDWQWEDAKKPPPKFTVETRDVPQSDDNPEDTYPDWDYE